VGDHCGWPLCAWPLQRLRAQDVTVKLGGTTSSETFEVTKSDDSAVFRVSAYGYSHFMGDVKIDRWISIQGGSLML